ncbi:MAG: GIY-YIG nuclease family protein [Maritalea sp.]
MQAIVYIVECADNSFYVGITHRSLEQRIGEHNSGQIEGYTKSRLPVKLVHAEEFAMITQAIARERQLKGWSRAKKKALIAGDFKKLSVLSKPIK